MYFCPAPGASRPWSQPGSAHMGILPDCLCLPLGKFSRKEPVNNLPKDALQSSRWLQANKCQPCVLRHSCLPDRTPQHIAWTLYCAFQEWGPPENMALQAGVLAPHVALMGSTWLTSQPLAMSSCRVALSPTVTASLLRLCAHLRHRHWGAVNRHSTDRSCCSSLILAAW